MKGRRAMTKNPPGRPPLDRSDKSTSVSIKLPTRVYDALDRIARQERTNVPTVIRQRLRLDPDDDD